MHAFHIISSSADINLCPSCFCSCLTALTTWCINSLPAKSAVRISHSLTICTCSEDRRIGQFMPKTIGKHFPYTTYINKMASKVHSTNNFPVKEARINLRWQGRLKRRNQNCTNFGRDVWLWLSLITGSSIIDTYMLASIIREKKKLKFV